MIVIVFDTEGLLAFDTIACCTRSLVHDPPPSPKRHSSRLYRGMGQHRHLLHPSGVSLSLSLGRYLRQISKSALRMRGAFWLTYIMSAVRLKLSMRGRET